MRSAYDASCLRASDHYDPLDYIFFFRTAHQSLEQKRITEPKRVLHESLFRTA